MVNELGWVHRDLKTENILVHNGILQVTDFGAAAPIMGKIRDGETIPKGVLHSTKIGTLQTMAPEVNDENHPFYGKYFAYYTDLWSLGVILFLFKSHSYPFHYYDEKTGILKNYNKRLDYVS